MDRIYEELSKLSLEEYKRLTHSKFESPEYEKWRQFSSRTTLANLPVHNDTTANNICYTAFSVIRQNFNEVKVRDFFTIQKSIIGEFYTLYIKSKISIKYSEGRITYPVALIVSPESKYASLFSEANDKIKAFSPNAQMIPFSILKMNINKEIPYLIGKEASYYEVLFGYEGDITKKHIIGNLWFKF